MATELKRIESSDVTDALMRAIDRAGEFEHIIIIGDKGDGGCIFVDHGNTVANMNYILDLTKRWLFGED